MTSELNALRVFIDTILAEHAATSMERQTDRDAVAEQLVEVIAEYLRPCREEGVSISLPEMNHAGT